jgi:hypothetical protein
MTAPELFVVIWGPVVLVALAPAIFAGCQDLAEWVRRRVHLDGEERC